VWFQSELKQLSLEVGGTCPMQCPIAGDANVTEISLIKGIVL